MLSVLGVLWKLGVLALIGPTWTAIGIMLIFGIGLMISVFNSRRTNVVTSHD
jgi:hypothetical protein